MKNKFYAFFSALLIGFLLLVNTTKAQVAQEYQLNLNEIQENTVKIKLTVGPELINTFGDTAFFLFPKTIPGTYAILDYGRYIENLTAKSADGQTLTVKKVGNNLFQIMGKPKEINYTVKDTYHTKTKKNKIFEPAGTNIQKDKNVIINNSGFFGYFRGQESKPLSIQVEKPNNMLAITSLNNVSTATKATFTARSYQELVDNPIMFSIPDTTSFMVANCKVTIGVFNESGRKISADIYKEIKTSMEALAVFFNNKLPVDHYSFIIYLKDYTEYRPIIDGEEKSIFKIIGALRSFSGQGFGALEHGTSSVYFLPDFGNNFALTMVKDVATHEFLHILTPLSLHSECVGDFNFENPVMSQHLWMYEGITEYFAGLAQVQNKVITPWDYLNKKLRGKIISAEKFPFTKMSFTEMSKNVYDKPYKDEYGQVYERGALVGALIDIEIITLTNGEKTLKDVLMSLSAKYGKDKSFSEKDFISEFVAASHPGMQSFFDKYITGRDTLPLTDIFAKVGVEYEAEYKGMVPKSPSEGLKYNMLTLAGKRQVKKVKKSAWVDFKKGDKVDASFLTNFGMTEYGYLKEGEVVNIPVTRADKEIQLEVKCQLMEGTRKHKFHKMANMTEQQQKAYNKWLNQ